MRRKFEQVLTQWKNNGMKKPMMVVGVRQIGKTYSIDKFARENFENYIYINLLEHSEIVKLCKSDVSVVDKIKQIEWIIGDTLDGDKKLILRSLVSHQRKLISYKYKKESHHS